jgi:uncharacterized protein YjbI with pentapeptide repeats
LVAWAFSTTDEDLLLEHTMPVSQIGVQVPVVFSFAIAPAVFLFLHAYTLIRYDMLAANLRQFRSDLQVSIPREADRERCRQLLANVEFVQVRTAPRSSVLHSWLYRLVAWLVLAGFPVATLIGVQISSLRYQSNAVTRAQQVCIAFDLLLLAWFFYRQLRREELSGNALRLRWVRYCVALLVTALVCSAPELFYLRVPRDDDQDVRNDHPKWKEAYRQPLDFGLCPALHWGCRYLTLDHRTLVGHVWTPQAIADLREEQRGDLKKSLAAIEGVFLRGRTLRYAKFDESRLYAVDMIGANVEHATFPAAQLQDVRWSNANLSGVDLAGANLSGADLSGARLSEAKLSRVNLARANLSRADLSGKLKKRVKPGEDPYRQGADLSGADLSEADLSGADLSGLTKLKSRVTGGEDVDLYLPGANLSGANLSGANLSGANLMGANLKANLSRANLLGAKLSWVGADLSEANLNEAKLSGADLSGADLSLANLSGADLSGAKLSGADLSGANLSRADLSKAKISADLMAANLSNAQLFGADLSRAHLWTADLSSAHLWGANLSGAYLVTANLSGASLLGANLSGANLRGATLSGADFCGASVTQDQLETALSSSESKSLSQLTVHRCK